MLARTALLVQVSIVTAIGPTSASTSQFLRPVKKGVPRLLNLMHSSQAFGSLDPVPRAMIKDGQRIPLILAEGLSTATVRKGDRVTFQVVTDVRVGDAVVIKRGAPAFASISEAEKRGVLGRGGRLSFEMEYVKAVDGQNLRLRATPTRDVVQKSGKAARTVEAVSAPIAIALKGRHVVAPRGTEYVVYADQDKEIRLEPSLPQAQPKE